MENHIFLAPKSIFKKYKRTICIHLFHQFSISKLLVDPFVSPAMPGLDCGNGRRCRRFLQPHLLAARDQRLALGPGEAGAEGGDAGQPGVFFRCESGEPWEISMEESCCIL